MKSRFFSPVNTSLASQWNDQETIKELFTAWQHEKVDLSSYLEHFFTYRDSIFRYIRSPVLSFECEFPALIPDGDEHYSKYSLDTDKGLTIYQIGLDRIKREIDKCYSVVKELNIVSSALETLQKIENNEPITLSMRQIFEEMIDKEKSKVVEDEKSQTNGSLESQNKRLNYLDRIKNIISQYPVSEINSTVDAAKVEENTRMIASPSLGRKK